MKNIIQGKLYDTNAPGCRFVGSSKVPDAPRWFELYLMSDGQWLTIRHKRGDRYYAHIELEEELEAKSLYAVLFNRGAARIEIPWSVA